MKNINIYSSLLCFLLFINCAEQTTTEKNEEKEEHHTHEDEVIITKTQFNNGDFEIGEAENKTFAETFRVTGMIDVPPKNRALVSSFFSGFVSKTSLLVGDEVQKGDLLLQLKNPDFIELQQNYAANASKLEYLNSEFQRKQNLRADQVISEKAFQKAKSDYLQMQAKVLGLKKTLQLMNVNTKSVLAGNYSDEISIYSPISGKIAKINVAQGMFLDNSTLIMEILDTDHVHLELDVFEKDILKVKKGDSLKFKIPEISDQKYAAYVQLIGAEVNENRSVRIHAHPINEDEKFAVGMFVEAYFVSNAKQEIALPSTAFVEHENKLHVLQLKEETADALHFKLIEVENLTEQNNFKPLRSDNSFSKKTRFLTQGAFDVVEGEGGGHDH
ncbi:efflux RND transporter periplasmic adaptor subunit [Psychroflexus salis]|uniref:Hemolysin D n=1 Tax=Psychroflexus salis TaxID=1526574 RepID=A0A916ZVL4_9FLAO|nr:efflux RND transporter periplasmic adaptor subunit [Psychroflexus salis]GGE15891.1 hemolysin D [Psychroflexus salis]